MTTYKGFGLKIRHKQLSFPDSALTATIFLQWLFGMSILLFVPEESYKVRIKEGLITQSDIFPNLFTGVYAKTNWHIKLPVHKN